MHGTVNRPEDSRVNQRDQTKCSIIIDVRSTLR